MPLKFYSHLLTSQLHRSSFSSILQIVLAVLYNFLVDPSFLGTCPYSIPVLHSFPQFSRRSLISFSFFCWTLLPASPAILLCDLTIAYFVAKVVYSPRPVFWEKTFNSTISSNQSSFVHFQATALFTCLYPSTVLSALQPLLSTPLITSLVLLPLLQPPSFTVSKFRFLLREG